MGTGTGRATPILVSGDTLPLHVVSQTGNEIVLGWAPPSKIIGYEFLVDGKRVSNSWDPTKSSVKFSYRQGAAYSVVAVTEGPSGKYIG